MNDQSSAQPTPRDKANATDTGPVQGGQASDIHTALTISRQYLKDISFENPNAPEIYSSFSQNSPELQFSIDLVASPLDDGAHEVVVSLAVTANQQQTTAFIIEVQYAAQVNIDKKVTGEELEELLMIEVPRYIFPFLRNIIANATREGGFPPLLLSPINFRQVYRERQQKTPASAAAQT